MEILQEVDAERMRTLRDREEYFWLDLTDPSSDDLDTISQFVAIHDLAREDTDEFSQRVKLDDYADSALLVVYGAEPHASGSANLIEVHLHLSDKALVTVTRESVTALDEARHHLAENPSAHPGQVLHGVLDALADSMLAALEGFDEAIENLQDEVAERPVTGTRQRIFELRHQLTDMRRVVVPQRDLLAPDDSLIDAIPHLHHDTAFNAIRDVYDHLDQATRLVDSYREQLASLVDLYHSEVSTRLNAFMKGLMVLATVFLPMTFIATFFGMNFGWLQQVITPAWTFFAFGVALPLAVGTTVAVYLRRIGAY